MSDHQHEPKTLAEWRKLRDLTQFQLAAQSGVSLSTITGVEARRHDIGIIAARKLAATLGVAVDAIIWPTDAEVEPYRQRRRAKKAAA